MIAATPLTDYRAADQRSGWQQALAQAITDPAELLNILQLDSRLLDGARQAAARFPLRVPRGYVRRMRVGDPHDPLLRQVLPLNDELTLNSDYVIDPVGDLASRAAPGVLHKYHGRALIVTTGACGVHCRYCFRRHFPYGDESATPSQWSAALDYLRNDTSIVEVILSGGDPLSLSDARLARMTADLQALKHLQRLRIHTRQPVVLPERVDAGLLSWLAAIRLPIVMVLHANHANEIDADVRAACRDLQAVNVTLLNQSVLLAGVNDNVDALVALSESLFAASVLPYYVHALDKVQGAAHFAVSESRILELNRRMTARLPGYLVPKFVKEIAGEPAKTAVELAAE